jgi:hypothetical protein
MRDRVRIAVKRTVADHALAPKSRSRTGVKLKSTSMRAQFAREQQPQALRFRGGLRDIPIPELAQRTHRRDGRESVPKALHAAAFVVDAYQQWRRT